jgi:hypothetical protein
MEGKDFGKIGYGPTRVLDTVSTRKTACHSGSLEIIREEIANILRTNRGDLLYKNLSPYIENRQFENLAAILDPIVNSLTDDTGRFRLCNFFELIGKSSFCLLFAEFSQESRSRIAEWLLKDQKIPFVTDVLNQLLTYAEDRPVDSIKFEMAATQLIFSKIVYRLLNLYEMRTEKQEILAQVYYLNYKDADDISLFINYLLRNYDECCTQGSPIEKNSRKIFGRIMGRFEQIFKERQAQA